MTTPATASPPIGVLTDDHDVRAMLVRFTVALNRRRAYAPTHPMVVESDEGLRQALHAVLARRQAFTLGVAHQELLLDLMPLGGGGAAMRELARRLHRREVGAITFRAGVTGDAVGALLAWLVADPTAPGARSDERATAQPPVGPDTNQQPDLPPALRDIQVQKVAYERLALSGSDRDADRSIAALWRALAAAALSDMPPGAFRTSPGDRVDRATAPPSDPESATGAVLPSHNAPSHELDAELDRLAEAPAEELADAIRARTHEAAHAQRVGVVLQTIASQLRTATPDVRREVAARLRAILLRLGESPLAAIIRASGSAVEQRRYVASLIDVLPTVAIVDWLEHMAATSEEQLSHHLLRILTKLSTHAGNRRASPDRTDAFRDAAQALISGWELDDPNPIEHGTLLNHIAADQSAPPAPPMPLPPVSEELSESDRETPDENALRLVQMACEIDVAGEDALRASRELVAAGHVSLLLSVLDVAPGRRAAAALREAITAREPLLHAMLKEPFDAAAARALLHDIPFAAAPTLLDALEHARVRSARRILLNTLQTFGAPLIPLLEARLEDAAPWYYVRNLLLLLRDVATDASEPSRTGAADASLRTFLDHPQEQVRIEALRVLLDSPTSRDLAIRRALEDHSPRLVAAAIEALSSGTGGETTGPRPMSRDVAGRLMRLAESPDLEPDLAARSVRALGAASGPVVRDWLLAQVTRRTRLLRRRTLADGPVAAAALQVLATVYHRDPAAVEPLAMARQLDAHDPRRLAVDHTPTRGAS
jgi:hypothetical protein